MTTEEYIQRVAAQKNEFIARHGEELFHALIPPEAQALPEPFNKYLNRSLFEWMSEAENSISRILSSLGLPNTGLGARAAITQMRSPREGD